MSYIANTAFEARITNNEWDNLCNVTGRFQSGSPAADADCSAGTLCVRGERLPCEGFTGVTNEHAFYMTAATSAANIDSVVYACNTYESQKIQGRYMGHETLGLGIEAGDNGTFTKIIFDNDHEYRFGVGNTSDGGEGSFYTIDGGALAVAAAAPTGAGSIYFEVTETGNFVEGVTSSFGYVQVRACRVSVAAG